MPRGDDLAAAALKPLQRLPLAREVPLLGVALRLLRRPQREDLVAQRAAARAGHHRLELPDGERLGRRGLLGHLLLHLLLHLDRDLFRGSGGGGGRGGRGGNGTLHGRRSADRVARLDPGDLDGGRQVSVVIVLHHARDRSEGVAATVGDRAADRVSVALAPDGHARGVLDPLAGRVADQRGEIDPLVAVADRRPLGDSQAVGVPRGKDGAEDCGDVDVARAVGGVGLVFGGDADQGLGAREGGEEVGDGLRSAHGCSWGWTAWGCGCGRGRPGKT